MNEEKVNQAAEKYTADSIKVLEGLEAVRLRPAMYIGSTGIAGLHHLVYEVVDNSIDEAMAGFCNKIDVIIHFDNSVTVQDNGRGIPVDMHKEEGKPAAEVVMTMLHAGGKFDNNAYKVSGGLHGVGVSVVNALSTKLELEIKRGGEVYFQKYEIGRPVTQLKKMGSTKKRGTRVTFWPDDEIFETIDFEYAILAKRLKELAYLNKGLTITFTDERIEKKEIFFYKGGILEYIQHLAAGKEPVHAKSIFLQFNKDDVEVDVGLQYLNTYNEMIFTFVNNIHTTEGGTHLTGFKGALTRTINNFAQVNNLKRDYKNSFSGDDVREGLLMIISVRMKGPQFEGQTKTKLGNSEIKGIVESFINEKLQQYFDENMPIAKAIINKVMLAAQAREASRKAKDLVRKSSLLESTSLPGKLADCQSKEAVTSEIFVVEGDSAGGSAKQGRDRRFQAILPLKGKILNVEKATTAKMLENEEIKTIIAALGVGIGKENFDLEKLRYHKIIIMTDADVDGSHIRTLILTFFFRHMLPIIENGYLYLAQPPLYMVKKGKKNIYLKNEKELENYLYEKMGEELTIEDEKRKISLKGAQLVRFIKLLNKKNSLIGRIEKHGMPKKLTSDLIEMIKDEDTFKDKIRTEEIANTLQDRKSCLSAVLSFDDEHSTYIIDLEYELSGVRMKRSINWDYLTGPLFAEINEVCEKLNAFPPSPYFLKMGNEELVCQQSGELVPLIFEKIKKGLYIQRYKGLGEMNPGQLWETTMDPQNRTLLKVNINDFFESESIFDTLMGSDSSKRKEFIFQNALYVRNIDV